MKTKREKLQEAARKKKHHIFVDVVRDDPNEARARILRALEIENGSTGRAAQRLDIDMPIIKRAMQQLGISEVPAAIRARAKRRFRLLD